MHMLIQLLGFTHPQDLFATDVLPDTFRRLWYFVASISFRSTEGFSNYLNEKVAMETSLHPAVELVVQERFEIFVRETMGYSDLVKTTV